MRKDLSLKLGGNSDVQVVKGGSSGARPIVMSKRI